MDIKQLIIGIEILIGMLLLGFFLGWVFPVEGPIDYVYDNYASQPAHKYPYAPVEKKQLIIDINDLSEEDFQALEAIFINRG